MVDPRIGNGKELSGQVWTYAEAAKVCMMGCRVAVHGLINYPVASQFGEKDKRVCPTERDGRPFVIEIDGGVPCDACTVESEEQLVLFGLKEELVGAKESHFEESYRRNTLQNGL